MVCRIPAGLCDDEEVDEIFALGGDADRRARLRQSQLSVVGCSVAGWKVGGRGLPAPALHLIAEYRPRPLPPIERTAGVCMSYVGARQTSVSLMTYHGPGEAVVLLNRRDERDVGLLQEVLDRISGHDNTRMNTQTEAFLACFSRHKLRKSWPAASAISRRRMALSLIHI